MRRSGWGAAQLTDPNIVASLMASDNCQEVAGQRKRNSDVDGMIRCPRLCRHFLAYPVYTHTH